MMQHCNQEQMKIINEQQLEMKNLHYYKDTCVDLFEQSLMNEYCS